MNKLIDKALKKPLNLALNEIERLLTLSKIEDRTILRDAARSLKRRYFGNRISIRGIIELGNICAKDCFVVVFHIVQFLEECYLTIF